jgi:hypothetical protein
MIPSQSRYTVHIYIYIYRVSKTFKVTASWNESCTPADQSQYYALLGNAVKIGRGKCWRCARSQRMNDSDRGSCLPARRLTASAGTIQSRTAEHGTRWIDKHFEYTEPSEFAERRSLIIIVYVKKLKGVLDASDAYIWFIYSHLKSIVYVALLVAAARQPHEARPVHPSIRTFPTVVRRSVPWSDCTRSRNRPRSKWKDQRRRP